MKEIIVSDTSELSFKEFLFFCQIWYQYLMSDISQFTEKVEKKLFNFKVERMELFKYDYYQDTAIKMCLRGINENCEKQGWFEKSTVKIDGDVMSLDCNHESDPGIKIATHLILYGNTILQKEYVKEDLKLSIHVDKSIVDKTFFPMDEYLILQVKSSDSISTYYYNLITGKLCIKNGEHYIELPEAVQEKIYSLLPTVSYNETALIRGSLKLVEKSGYIKKGKMVFGEPSALEKFFNPDIQYVKKYELEEQKTEKTQPSFEEYVLNGVKYDFDTSKNSEDIKGSIKNLLTKLKENDDGTVNIPRIKLSDGIFYVSITPEKKEIDPFFKDPDIIKYCDLSGIDFTNADITFSCLAYSGAKIVLKDLYNKSIEGADLEGVSLHGQDLDDINANNANLVKTGIFVSLERTSVIGAKFSSSSTFMMGINVLSYEQVVSMGIDIANESEEIELKQKL